MDVKKAFGITAMCLTSGFIGAIGSHNLFTSDAKADSGAGTVTAKRFEIVDNEGKTRAVWTTSPKGEVILAFYEKNNIKKSRMVLFLAENNVPVITLNGSAGHDVIGMSVNSDDSAAINFSDKANKVRGSIVIERNGEFSVETKKAQ